MYCTYVTSFLRSPWVLCLQTRRRGFGAVQGLTHYHIAGPQGEDSNSGCLPVTYPQVPPEHGPGDRGSIRSPPGRNEHASKGSKCHGKSTPTSQHIAGRRHCQFRGTQAEAVGWSGERLLHPPTDPAARYNAPPPTTQGARTQHRTRAPSWTVTSTRPEKSTLFSILKRFCCDQNENQDSRFQMHNSSGEVEKLMRNSHRDGGREPYSGDAGERPAGIHTAAEMRPQTHTPPHTHTGRFHLSLTGSVHTARWQNPFQMGLVHSLQDVVLAQEITF